MNKWTFTLVTCNYEVLFFFKTPKNMFFFLFTLWKMYIKSWYNCVNENKMNKTYIGHISFPDQLISQYVLNCICHSSLGKICKMCLHGVVIMQGIHMTGDGMYRGRLNIIMCSCRMQIEQTSMKHWTSSFWNLKDSFISIP